MKKIALASAAMGGVALFAFGASGTFAAMTDTEEVTTIAEAGTMDLKVGGEEAVRTANVGTLNPGEARTASYWINNAGTTAGDLTAKLSVVDAENGCTDAESKLTGTGADDCSAAGATAGELSKYAKVQFLDASADSQAACASATDGTALSTIGVASGVQTSLGALSANQGNCVVLKVTLPGTAGNIVQSDTAQWKAALTLTQQVSTSTVTAPIAPAPGGLSSTN